jgi:NhaP-type Na+/H+ or K+/H+ antiporter
MDLFVTAAVAFIFIILAVLVAIVTRKKIGKILLYGIVGLIIGLPIGHFLTPTIISFF